MSNHSQGYLFGILQRGAHPVGQANRARRAPARQGALEQSDVSYAARADAPGDSFSPARINDSTQNIGQTEQLERPPTRQAPPPPLTAGALPDTLAARVRSLPPPDIPLPTSPLPASPLSDSKAMDSASDPMTPSAIRHDETFSPARSNVTPESRNQTSDVVRPPMDHVARPPTRQSETRPTVPIADAPPRKPKAKDAPTRGLLRPDSPQSDIAPVFSTSEPPNSNATVTPGESSSLVDLNGIPPSLDQTNHVVRSRTGRMVHRQTRQSPSQSTAPAPAPAPSAEKSKATILRVTRSSQPDSTQENFSSDSLKPSAPLTPGEPPAPANLDGIPQTPNQASHAVHSQTDQVVQPQTRQAEPRLPIPDAGASPEKSKAATTRETSVSRPDNQVVPSSFQRENSSAIESRIPRIPVADPARTHVEPPQADTRLNEPRLPRLIVIEQGKTVAPDNSRSVTSEDSRSVARKERSIVVREERENVFDSQSFTAPLGELLTDERRLSATPLPSGQASTFQADAQPHAPLAMPARGNRVASEKKSASGDAQSKHQAVISLEGDLSESVEPVRSLPLAEVLLVETLRSQRSALPSHSAPLEPGESVIASLPELWQESPLTHFHPRQSDSIPLTAKVTPIPTLAERREEAAWPTSIPEQPEERFSKRPFNSPQPRREAPPKLTINRLDVQIVNQSSVPTAPLPPAQPSAAVRPAADAWEKLERHQLGHLDLIF